MAFSFCVLVFTATYSNAAVCHYVSKSVIKVSVFLVELFVFNVYFSVQC